MKNDRKITLSMPLIDDKLRARLAHGARLRAGIMEQIERGEEPAPAYRVEWLRETAKEIVLLVARRGEAFTPPIPTMASAWPMLLTPSRALGRS